MTHQVGCNGVNIIVDPSVESFHNVMRTTINRQAQAAITDLDAAYHDAACHDAAYQLHQLRRHNHSQIHGIQVFVSMSYDMRLLDTQADLEDQIARRDQADIAQDLAQLSLHTIDRVRETDYHDIVMHPAEEIRQAQLPSVATSLDSLPVVSLDVLEQESQDCPVCQQPFPGSDPNEPDTPVLLRCNHIVGRACIERWVSEHHNSCPMCRAPVLEPGLLPVLADEEQSETGESGRRGSGQFMGIVNRHIAQRLAQLEAGESGQKVPDEVTFR